MLTQVAIPSEIGAAGAHLAPSGASGSPDLKQILEDQKTAIDANNGDAVALTDTSPTITVAQGRWRRLPITTLTTGRTLTLGITGAKKGDEIEVTRLDVTANTYAVANGGAGAGTLITFPVSKLGYGRFRFNGANWELKAFGMQP